MDEVKEVVREYVLPVLKVMNKMMVVTGRGVHSSRGKSQLRRQVREYFASLKVRCEDVAGNEGAFYAFKD